MIRGTFLLWKSGEVWKRKAFFFWIAGVSGLTPTRSLGHCAKLPLHTGWVKLRLSLTGVASRNCLHSSFLEMHISSFLSIQIITCLGLKFGHIALAGMYFSPCFLGIAENWYKIDRKSSSLIWVYLGPPDSHYNSNVATSIPFTSISFYSSME